jgi:hypothetical protein
LRGISSTSATFAGHLRGTPCARYAARARLLISRHGFKSLYVATDDAAVAAAVTARSEELFGLRRSAVFVADVDRTLYARGYYNKVLKQTPADEARADAEAILDDVLLLVQSPRRVILGYPEVSSQRVEQTQTFRPSYAASAWSRSVVARLGSRGRVCGKVYVQRRPSRRRALRGTQGLHRAL